MRIALVSPYSWTYPGGVTRHIEALADELLATGHDVRVLAPVDPDDALAARLHRGARPQARALPEYLVPLGRTIGLPFNGAVSTLALHPYAVTAFRSELARFAPDVVHVHEPMAPMPGWEACSASPGVPVVGTFHAYATNPVTNNLGNLAGAWRRFNRLHARIAVSEAAAWTGRRFFGGHYTVVPNGVHVDPALAPKAPRLDGDPLKIAFVGQAVERKGLEILLPAFEALRDHVPVQLTIVGASERDVAPLLLDPRGVTALGKVDDEAKTAILRGADVLCAPSLGGESFGMVLTEAFAAGTPVVASDIAGYRDVVRDGADGVLVPKGDATALATTLRELALDPARTTAMGEQAARSAQRFAWPTVTQEVLGVYEEARAVAPPETAGRRFAVRHGLVTADGRPMRRPRRLPRPEPAPAPGTLSARRPALAFLRRAVLGLAGLATIALALLALQRIGVDRVVASLLQSQPAWVVAGLGVMCASMVLRAGAWRAILRAGLPDAVVDLGVAIRATSIGVLMSATLPARLGEPSRALIVARRVGRPRDTLPVVVGTIVSQTLLNALALVILGLIMFSTVDVFTRSGPLVLAAVAPVVLVLAVVLAPLVAGRGRGESRVAAFAARARNALLRTRSGLSVFRSPRLGTEATVLQLSAWVLQALSCYILLVALGIDGAGIGAAAAVLFAVNVTAVLPLTPSNIGTFQLACAAVLGAYGVSYADGIAYGVILQAVEVATAFIMGAPALVREGVTWRDVRVRALHTTPVELPPLPAPANS